MKKTFIGFISILTIILFIGCASSITHKVGYPAADELFITVGDDPGSESNKPYTPKGQFIHVETEAYLPFPIFGMFVKFGNAEPQYIFDTVVIPQVKKMGGDALIGAKISYTPPSPWFTGLIGMRAGGQTIIIGQVVKK